ncbi:uncharacterized protein LOC144903701 [Branchiostoma floridae x Branchiostoma belcheri]
MASNFPEVGADAEGKKRDLQELLGKVETEISELSTSADAAIEKATEYFDHLMALLRDRKEEVVKEIGSRRQEVGKYLEAQKEEIEFELAGLTRGSGSEGQARQRVEELLTTPARPSHVVFSEGTAVAEFREAVAKAGCVQVTGKVDASKCSVEVKPAVFKFSNVALLTTVDGQGRSCVVAEDDVKVILTDSFGRAVQTNLQKSKGLWEISYTPELTGNHRLEVTVKGQPVAGSPYDVRVQASRSPVLTIRGEIGSHPVDVAMGKDGNIAVLKNGKKRVRIFDVKTGQSLRWFTVDGEDPFGIDIDSDGHFIVTCRNISDTGKQAILVYSPEGELAKILKPESLQNPRGVAVLKDGRMVVADDTRQSCLLLQPDGSLIREIGKGQLQGPWFIAVDESRGLLSVTDCDGHKVCVFDLEGNLKVKFGKWGRNEGELYHPSGVTYDPAGNIIVASWGSNRLQVFQPDGTYLRSVAIVKEADPRGIALTHDGHIAVASWFGYCVELYGYK